MRLEEVIGLQIAEKRASAGMSQAELGEALGQHLERAWSRQAVHSAEKGKRAFTAAELVAFALVLEAEVPDLMTPPLSQRDGVIELPSSVVPARRLADIVAPEAPDDVLTRMNLDGLHHLVPMLSGTIQTLQLLDITLSELIEDAQRRKAGEDPEGVSPLVKEQIESRARLAQVIADALGQKDVEAKRVLEILQNDERAEAVRREAEGDG
ncbi:helix-turn-helix transcriptional regulator [Streptomyces indiaensis]|uniref:HTH cro/C1-type domain-containing protein n=1 Tax=Streptomyces indiaensis TaxID=284033 RepID=A0ABN3D461_9ACTN|nr:helix-turn-helix transcriptional regulator [Streptomyces indiaensis]MCF1645487.1 helix-turn-helix transcriptional regulator [Streptomyces indiaensis]